MAVVNGGYFHYVNMNIFLENRLLWNYLSYFEIVS